MPPEPTHKPRRARAPRGSKGRSASPAPPTCREVLERICAEAGRAKDSPFCLEVARHIEACEKCRAQAVTLRGTVALYRCLEREEIPEEVARRLRERLGIEP